MKASESVLTRGRASTSNEPSRRSISDPALPRDSRFVSLALAGEGALALLAVALGRVFGINPVTQLQPGWGSLFWGVLATVPLLLALTWILRRPAGGLRRLVDFVVSQLGPLLANRSHAELALLAALAGLGEELLFRGVIQTGLARVVPVPLDLLAASSLFGLAHFATATYAIVAGFMGLYLGALFLVQGTLFAPIVTHALYDFVALLLVVRRYRASQNRNAFEVD